MVKLSEIKPLPLVVYTMDTDSGPVSFVVEPGSSDLNLLSEAQHRGIPLGGPYSAVHHKAHIDPGYDHLHVFCKNNILFALNSNGTAHDQSHGIKIPNRVADGIRRHFPDFVIPPDNLIESAPLEIQSDFVQQLNG